MTRHKKGEHIYKSQKYNKGLDSRIFKQVSTLNNRKLTGFLGGSVVKNLPANAGHTV